MFLLNCFAVFILIAESPGISGVWQPQSRKREQIACHSCWRTGNGLEMVTGQRADPALIVLIAVVTENGSKRVA